MKTICLILGLTILSCAMVVKAKDFKFPEITGWKQSGEIQTFIPKTLYEYIIGEIHCTEISRPLFFLLSLHC